MIFNLVFIIISTLVLYWKRVDYYKDASADKINKSNNYLYNNIYLPGTIISQLIINIITNIINCSSNISAVLFVMLYTLMAWVSFIIIVYSKDYLRIPMANVFGYIWCSAKIKPAIYSLNLVNNDMSPFDLSSTIIQLENSWRTDSIQLPTATESSTDDSNSSLNKLLHIYCLRDLIGEFVLFTLSGIMSVFMAEYLLITNTCNK